MKTIVSMLKDGTATVTKDGQYLVLKLPDKKYQIRVAPLLAPHRQQVELEGSGIKPEVAQALLGSEEDRQDLQVEMMKRSGRWRA